MLKIIAAILSLLIYFSTTQAGSYSDLAKRCQWVSTKMEELGWEQRSETCRHYIWLGSGWALKAAKQLNHKHADFAHEAMTHVRTLIDYANYNGCIHSTTIHLIPKKNFP